MSDAVVFAEVVAIAQDLAVVRVPGPDGAFLGVCRIPAATITPVGTWFPDLHQRILPLLVRCSEAGPVAELVIAGTPLKAVLQSGAGERLLPADDYPWDAWNRAAITEPPTSTIVHTTHSLVGVTAIIILLILIAARRSAAPDPSAVRTGSAIGRTLRRGLGGMLGLGRESFTNFPPPPSAPKGRQS